MNLIRHGMVIDREEKSVYLVGLASAPGRVTMTPSTREIPPCKIYTLRNASGCEARISDYGGIVVSLIMPDRHGRMDDVVLGFDEMENYLGETPYFGALIGRFGNRIAKGRFTLDGQGHELPINNAPNSLHGGVKGFDKRVWKAREFSSPDGPALALEYVSADGEEGYPGTLTVKMVYTLTDDNALRVAFEATTDAPTVVNLTNHSYFDLRGAAGEGDVLDHEVMLNSSRYLPVDEGSIPLGELRSVAGTAFDFREPRKMGARIQDDDSQLHIGPGGYDHTFVLAGYDRPAGAVPEITLAARVCEPTSGRVLELWTSEPGVQFYSGNFLDGSLSGKGGKRYGKQSAFCLEPQHFPDSPNRPEYPSTVLRPGETYRNTFEYRFSVK